MLFRSKVREYWRRHNRLPSSKSAQKRYAKTAKGKARILATRRRYKASPKGLASAARDGAQRHKRLSAMDCSLTASEWAEIKTAHGHKCYYCGRKMERLTMDHVIPLVKNGKHTKEDVVPACQSCNSQKGTKLWLLC